MTLDTILWVTCSLAEAAVIVFLFYRRAWRIFPFFFAYSIWSLLGNDGGFAILHWYPPSSPVYVSAYLIELLADSVLLFAVLVELAWSVLRPLRGSLPRKSLIVIAFLILAVGVAIWPFATLPGIARLGWELALLIRLKQTIGILSVLVFLILAAGSQFLAIGWRDRELQIATGLGLYSLVGVVVTVLHTYPQLRAEYNRLDQFLVASYLCSLIYWIASFAQQEQERREMSPQMQDLLLAMAGTARTTRAALTNPGSHSQDKKKDR